MEEVTMKFQHIDEDLYVNVGDLRRMLQVVKQLNRNNKHIVITADHIIDSLDRAETS